MKQIGLSGFFLILLIFPMTAAPPDALQEYRRQNFQEAVDICLAELKTSPGNLNSYIVLGWSLLRLGRHNDAVNYSAQAHNIHSKNTTIIQILAEAHFYLNNNPEALRFYQMLAALKSGLKKEDLAAIYFSIGEVHLRLSEYHHADIALSYATYLKKNNPDWWRLLGYSREMAHSTELALSAYRQALALDNDNAEAIAGLERLGEQP